MRKVLIGLAAVAMLAASCGDDDDTADALTEVCDSQESVLADLEALAALDPTADSAETYRAALEDLQDSVDDLRAARQELVEQDVANIESAFDALRSELEGLDNVPLADIGDEISGAVTDQAAELEELYRTAYENSSCEG